MVQTATVSMDITANSVRTTVPMAYGMAKSVTATKAGPLLTVMFAKKECRTSVFQHQLLVSLCLPSHTLLPA